MLSDTSPTEVQNIETDRANKRAKFSSMEEDVGIFRNVRLSHDELSDPPKLCDDAPDTLETSGLQDHDSIPSSDPKYQSVSEEKVFYPPLTISGEEDGSTSLTERTVEFDDALDYVNKIKNRFSDHPGIYKQFLEMLKTYQRDEMPVQDLVSQVGDLFASAPDLVVEFKQFIPESVTSTKATVTSAAQGGDNYEAGKKRKRDSLDTGQSQGQRLDAVE